MRVIARSAWRNRGWRRNKNPMAMPINNMVNMLIIYAFFIIGYDDNDMEMSYRIKNRKGKRLLPVCVYVRSDHAAEPVDKDREMAIRQTSLPLRHISSVVIDQSHPSVFFAKIVQGESRSKSDMHFFDSRAQSRTCPGYAVDLPNCSEYLLLRPSYCIFVVPKKDADYGVPYCFYRFGRYVVEFPCEYVGGASCGL